MMGQTNKAILSKRLQRTLRKNLTDAEKALWSVLRGRQMSGLKFRRQHPFADYILDFVCLEKMLIIEVDGSQHGEQTGYDEIRTLQLQAAGFHVLRFWNNEMLQNMEAVEEQIWMAVQKHRTHPHPDPPREGEGAKGLQDLR
jgi:very-short-patch-repair endonuclease